MSKIFEAGRFTIREIIPGDITHLLQIAEVCHLSPWSRDDYNEEAKRTDSTMLGLESAAGEMVGFLVGRRVMSGNSANQFDAELYNIGIKPGFQRQGGGRILLNAFLQTCRKERVHNVWLDVRSSNKKAMRFYKNFGFTEYAARTSFYSNPAEDGIVMKLTL